MTPKEESKFLEMTKDLEAENQRKLREYIEGNLREIAETVPEEQRKYNIDQVSEEEAEIVIKILEIRLEAINEKLEALENLLISKDLYC